MKTLTAEEKIALLREVHDATVNATEVISPIGRDLCYLYSAIADGNGFVEWYEPVPDPNPTQEDGELVDRDIYVCTVKLFRAIFPKEHPVWRFIRIESPDPPVNEYVPPFESQEDYRNPDPDWS